jgi:hypothetical protein
MFGPSGHDDLPMLKIVSAPVSPLYGAPNDMPKTGFSNFVRRVSRFSQPDPQTCPKTMRALNHSTPLHQP